MWYVLQLQGYVTSLVVPVWEYQRHIGFSGGHCMLEQTNYNIKCTMSSLSTSDDQSVQSVSAIKMKPKQSVVAFDMGRRADGDFDNSNGYIT